MWVEKGCTAPPGLAKPISAQAVRHFPGLCSRLGPGGSCCHGNGAPTPANSLEIPAKMTCHTKGRLGNLEEAGTTQPPRTRAAVFTKAQLLQVGQVDTYQPKHRFM